jgi:hypothetical protein
MLEELRTEARFINLSISCVDSVAMGVRRIVAALVILLDLTPTWAIEVRNAPPPVSTAHGEVPADCIETSVQATPLPPRPVLRRATHAYRPKRHHRVRAGAHRRPAARRKHVNQVKHRKHRARHRHRAAPHHPHAAARTVRRISYPSPICAKRSHLINALIGLPDQDEAVTQPPVPPEETADVSHVTTPPSWPTPGSGVVDYPTTIFPYTPIYPPGPGPIILPPVPPVGPNPPLPPPVFPISGAPEPGSWIMMGTGFALIGGSLRRTRRSYSGAQARSSPS